MPPTAFLVLSALCLSVGVVLAKGLIAGGLPFSIADIGPLAFVTFQLIGSLVFLVSVAISQSTTFALGRAWPILMIAGLILGLGSIGTVMALVFIPVGEASVIWAMQPFAMIILAWFVLKEPTPIPTILLSIVGVGGVILIVTSGVEGTARNRLLGSVFASGTALAAAAYTVWMRQVRESVDPFSALIVVQASTLIVVICAWAFAATTGLVSGATPGWWDISAAMATGAVYYGLAYILFLFGLRWIEAGKAGMFLNLVPVFTILLAFFVLGERLSSVQWIGAAIVVTAVALSGWMNRATNR